MRAYNSDHYAELAEQKWDAIVIGSGLGGMTTATLLAMAKKKVLLLERHYVPGGFTHTFKRKGFEWDVGVHYVGQMHNASILRKIFDYVGGGMILWEPMGSVHDRAIIAGKSYDSIAGREAQIENLVRRFPAEEKAIRGYVALIHSVGASGAWFFGEKTMPPFLSRTLGRLLRMKFEKWAAKTTYEVISNFTKNPELISALCVQCGDYGLTPKQSSFGIHAVVVDHYMDGASYPIGGAKTIHESILSVFEKNGGTVLLKADVASILVEKNRAVGVELSDGRKLSAPIVVSNVGYRNTWTRLLKNSEAAKLPKADLAKVNPSVAHICLYVGLDRSDADLKIPKHNIWIYDDADFDRLNAEQAGDPSAAKNLTYISFPSAKDPAWAAKNPGRSSIQIIRSCSFKQVDEWKTMPFGKRGFEYDVLKEAWSTDLLEKLFEVLPQARGHVVVTELSTPLSTRHFMNYENGEIYGLEHTPQRFAMQGLRPQTSIKGLYLTGQDIVTVGVGGAIYSGVLAATKVLNKSVMMRILLGRTLIGFRKVRPT